MMLGFCYHDKTKIVTSAANITLSYTVGKVDKLKLPEVHLGSLPRYILCV